MTNFEKIKAMDKADIIDLLLGIKEGCTEGNCRWCPLESVKDSCTPTNLLRWLESEAKTNESEVQSDAR